MSIGSVLLHVSAENIDSGRGPTAWALGLAAEYRVPLTALAFELDVVLPRSAYGHHVVVDSRAALDARNRDLAARAVRLRTAADELGVDAEVITDRSFAYGVPEIVADHSRLHDIIVSGVDQTGLLSERSIAEHLLFEAGRPVVVVPKDYEVPFQCERIVVAWDWGRASARALGDAMPLLRRARDVSIVTFGDDKQLDTSLGKERLTDALLRRGAAARYETADRGNKSIGEALCAFALDRGADLLVMGGFGHSRLRRFLLGGATRAVLDGPGLPTLLSH